MTQNYDAAFYKGQVDGSLRSATAIVPILLRLLPVRSVGDVGCGVGAWLSVFMQHGVSDVLGIDGAYVPRDHLRIPESAFLAANLARPLQIGRTFDLVISLEVAEHLPSPAAPAFVESLTRLAPVVLFSAAIPHQGGTDHVNERWPDYWADLFRARGYRAMDAVRWRIWDDTAIDFWYKQNMLVYVENSSLASYPELTAPVSVESLPKRLVHPALLEIIDPPESLGGTIKKLPRLFSSAIRRRVERKGSG
jgi:SAM-dependent methyltransferase